MSNLFKKYYSRVAKEGVVKSLMWAFSIGFAAVALCALISWIVDFKIGAWICLALFVVSVGVALPLFYFKHYRPTTRAIAARIDELGLEERVITMAQLEKDTSYMAMRQREDALNAMGAVNPMLVKLKVSGSHIITLAATAALGVLLVCLLLFVPFPKSGPKLHNFSLRYSVGSGIGEIKAIDDLYKEDAGQDAETLAAEEEKETLRTQICREGEDGEAVYAMPADGYVFVCWSDGVMSPYRQDKDVTKNISVFAVFEKIGVPDDVEPEDPYLGTESGELVNNGAPTTDEDSENGGNGGGGSDELPPPPSPNDSENNDERGAEEDQIIDGDTYYGDTFDNARNDANDRFNSDTNLDDATKGELNKYYDSISKGGSGNDGGEGGDTGEGGGE